MRVLLISDVHANLPALEAVLTDAPETRAIVHAGDVVGYNPYPRKVIEVFREHGVESIEGNHDRAVAGGSAFGFNTLAGRAVEWTRDLLLGEELEYVGDLPVEETYFDGRVHAAHGAPGDPDRYTYPKQFTADLLEGEDILVLGHTHVQGKREFSDGVVVNPGSVGQPRDGDPRAAYAVLDLDDGRVDLKRVEYPVREVQEKINEAGLPERLSWRLEEGR